MSWSYRVMQHESDGSETSYLAIHEVYDEPSGWTTDPVSVDGASVEELREVLEAMLTALDEPVLGHKTGRDVIDD